MRAHDIQSIVLREDRLVLTVDGRVHTVPLAEVSARLAAASPAERERFEVSPSGYGIHWPLLDEDLSIDGLLGVVHLPQRVVQTGEPKTVGESRAERAGEG